MGTGSGNGIRPKRRKNWSVEGAAGTKIQTAHLHTVGGFLMDEIVVNESLVIAATVLLGFIFNQVLAYFGIELETKYKKLIVFVLAVGLSAYAMTQAGLPGLPDVSADPSEFALMLLGVATLNFRVAQVVYDRLWQALLQA
jgi:hypothetical protein